MPFDPSTARAFDPSSAQPAPAAAPAAQPQQDSSPMGMVKEAGDVLFTALHGAADTATFGLADKASAGILSTISPLTGEPMSYHEAYQKIQDNNGARSGRNPVASTAGDVAGMFIGGAGLAKAASKVPALASAAEALQPVARSPFTNVAKAAATGAAASGGYTATDDLIRNGDIDPNNVITNAAAGAVLGPAVSKIGTSIARGVQNTSTKAMMILADKLGENPGTLQRAYDSFNAATGRVPTMAELVTMKQAGELKTLAANNPAIQEGLNAAESTANSQRPQALAQNIENAGGPAQDITTLARARSDRMDAAMAPIRRTTVGIDQNDVGLLTDPRTMTAVRRAKDPELRTRVSQAIDDVEQHGQSDILTVHDIDNLRQSLRSEQANLANTQSGRGNSVAAQHYGDHIENITALGTSAEPGYQDALSQFSRDSDYMHGFKHGTQGKAIGEAADAKLQRALESPEGQQGHAAGVATRNIDAAAASPSSAVRTADSIAAGTGDSAVLRQSMGQGNFDTVQRAAQAESTGAKRLSEMTGSVPNEPEGFSGKELAQGIGAAASHSPSGILFHASRAIPNFKKLPDPVQRQIARYLSTPELTQQGINLLRRAGAKDDQIRKLAVALSANAGLNAANTLGQ